MGAVEVGLTVDAPLEVYTSGDILSGAVALTLNEDVSIGEVAVTLECEELAKLSRSSGRTLPGTDRDHMHFQEAVKLFPSTNVPTSTGYFTLKKGQHLLPFSFRLPLDTNLPETRIFHRFSYIKWQLKASIERELTLSPYIAEWDFRFVPARVPAESPAFGQRKLAGTDRVEFKTYTEGYERSLSSVFGSRHRLATTHTVDVYACPLGVLQWPLQSTLDVVLRPSVPDVATLRRLRLILDVRDNVLIDHNRAMRRALHGLLDVNDLDILIGKELSLQRVLEAAGRNRGLQVPSIGAGSFQALHHNRQVWLRIDLYFGSRHYPSTLKHRQVRLQVAVAPESVAALRAAVGLAPPAFFSVDDSDGDAPPPYEANGASEVEKKR